MKSYQIGLITCISTGVTVIKKVTINTHLGLFRYLRLPFGVASAPALFRETIDKILNRLKQAGCILDDIVTGTDDDDHLKNLKVVLQRLNDMNIKHMLPNVISCKIKLNISLFG